MPRPPSVQITRNLRSDNSVTYSLRVRVAGGDETVPLGNTGEGWDEARADRARRQLLAKIELGLWTPGTPSAPSSDGEPTFAEMATDWLADRQRNPAIRPRTTDDDRWRLTRYLIPSFGHLRPSQITPSTIKQYRRRIHEENEHIRAARAAGQPLRDPRSGTALRTLSNDSINKTLRTLAAILDEAEDAGWITRNVARGRRTREPVERRTTGALEADEFLSMVEAAAELDRSHKPRTLERAHQVQAMRDDLGLGWDEIRRRLRLASSTAFYLYGCRPGETSTGPRQAVIATLGLAGLRVTELCALDRQHVDLNKAKIYIRDAKTAAGVRVVDIRPRLLEVLAAYPPLVGSSSMDVPAFATRTGSRRERNNVQKRIVLPVLKRANELRNDRGQPPIAVTVTPHTFRRTYITIMLAAGFDLPYVQDQVGHTHPMTTLAIYARVIRRPDRDAVRAELRTLFGEAPETAHTAHSASPQHSVARRDDHRQLAIER